MALLLQCRNIKKDFGVHKILKQVSFDLEEGECLGLVGINGSGKTTLANIIYGSIKADGGDLLWHKEPINIGYLRQSVFYSSAQLNDLLTKDENVNKINDFLHITSMLGNRAVHSWEDQRFDGLSGGERTKLALAGVWAESPDLLILDEPTNHLDFQGTSWLISELKGYKGTIIIISHDRYFLDKTVDRILELEDGRLEEYKGNYSYYRREKEKRYQASLHAYQIQEEYKKRLNDQIRQLKGWSSKAHRESTKFDSAGNKMGTKEYKRVKAKKLDRAVKSKLKRLERLKVEGVEKPKVYGRVKFAFESEGKGGKSIIDARGIGKAFGDRTLFADSSFYIQRGERIGIFGQNGCGKTTLIKAFMGQESLSGSLFVSPGVRIGYVCQDVHDMTEDTRALDMFEVADRRQLGLLRTLLANMGLREQHLQKQVSDLSLGERTRLKLAKLIYHDYDLLILDEPTNHLDLQAREQLEEALSQYEGTIILVTHDRYMLEQICEKLLVFKNGIIRRIEQEPKAYLKAYETSYQESGGADKEDISKDHKPGLAADKASKTGPMEDEILLDHELARVLARLSMAKADSQEYQDLDDQYQDLLARKKALRKK